MKLTTEEKAKLKSNIEKIKAYIEAEISPKLCGEAITVYFGNVVHFCQRHHREAVSSLCRRTQCLRRCRESVHEPAANRHAGIRLF